MRLHSGSAGPVGLDGELIPRREAAPVVSVMMDVSDGERYLDAALASLSGQSFADFEIVLCAHGVTPATRAVIERWAEREPRLRVLWRDRLRLSRAHNVAARAARGRLLARLDADDIALPHRLARQVEMLDLGPHLGLVGSAVEQIDARGRSLGLARYPLSDEAIRGALLHRCPIVHSSVMMRAEAFWRAGGYREGLDISEDYDLYARMLESSAAANSAEPLVCYRVHSGSLTSTRPVRMVVTTVIVRAAIVARARHEAEPFAMGVPSLRRSQVLLGLSRDQLARMVFWRAWRGRLLRMVMMYRAPLRSVRALRGLALAFDPRPMVGRGLRAFFGSGESRSARASRPQSAANATR